MTFSETVQDLIGFVRAPRLEVPPGWPAHGELGEELPALPEPDEEIAAPDPFKRFFHLLMLSLMLGFGIMMVLGGLNKAGLVPELPHAMEDVMKQYPFWMVLLLAAVAAPLMEEVAFRLWLVHNRSYVLISIWVIALFLGGTLLQSSIAVAGYAVFAFASFVTICLLAFREASDRALHQLYYQHYQWLFWGAALVFAIMHLINFELNLQILMLAPLLVLPQLLLGLLLGYLRVKQGLIWAIALHALYNTIILGLAFAGMKAELPTADCIFC